MADTKTSKNQAALHLFDEIASAARAVKDIHRGFTNGDEEVTEAMLSTVVRMIGQIGWMAEVGAKHLGSDLDPCYPEYWILSPAYQAAKIAVEAPHA